MKKQLQLLVQPRAMEHLENAPISEEDALEEQQGTDVGGIPGLIVKAFPKKERPEQKSGAPINWLSDFLQILLNFFSQCGNHIKKVPDHTVVSLLKDRRILILIDGNNHF
jgi:hypothetical protein